MSISLSYKLAQRSTHFRIWLWYFANFSRLFCEIGLSVVFAHRCSSRVTTFSRWSSIPISHCQSNLRQSRALTESTADLICLARNKELDPVMLVIHFFEEHLLKPMQRGINMAGDRDGLALVFRSIDLEEVLQCVVINVI